MPAFEIIRYKTHHLILPITFILCVNAGLLRNTNLSKLELCTDAQFQKMVQVHRQWL
jgi:hypothetical protein